MTSAVERTCVCAAALTVVIAALAFLIQQAGRDKFAAAVALSGAAFVAIGFISQAEDRARGRSRWRQLVSTGESTYATGRLPQRGRAYPAVQRGL